VDVAGVVQDLVWGRKCAFQMAPFVALICHLVASEPCQRDGVSDPVCEYDFSRNNWTVVSIELNMEMVSLD
jgi:hypothetical protein